MVELMRTSDCLIVRASELAVTGVAFWLVRSEPFPAWHDCLSQQLDRVSGRAIKNGKKLYFSFMRSVQWMRF